MIATAKKSNRVSLINDALTYAEYGLRIVLLPPNEKKANEPRWGYKTTLDQDALADRFVGRMRSNIGVKLGKYPDGDPLPGVIDIEFDDEEGRATAARVFSDDDPDTPTYSSKRSIHRLFRWQPWMPITPVHKCGGLEYRLGGHGTSQTQSVLPPSYHPDGHRYQWLSGLSITDCEIADVPESIERFLRRIASGYGFEFSAKPIPPDQQREYSDSEVEWCRYLLSLCTSKHADDYDSWFRLATAAKTVGGNALMGDWLRLASISTRHQCRDRYRRQNAIRKWNHDIKPNGTASVHTIERIVLGHAMPDDFAAIHFANNELKNQLGDQQ